MIAKHAPNAASKKATSQEDVSPASKMNTAAQQTPQHVYAQTTSAVSVGAKKIAPPAKAVTKASAFHPARPTLPANKVTDAAQQALLTSTLSARKTTKAAGNGALRPKHVHQETSVRDKAHVASTAKQAQMPVAQHVSISKKIQNTVAGATKSAKAEKSVSTVPVVSLAKTTKQRALANVSTHKTMTTTVGPVATNAPQRKLAPKAHANPARQPTSARSVAITKTTIVTAKSMKHPNAHSSMSTATSLTTRSYQKDKSLSSLEPIKKTSRRAVTKLMARHFAGHSRPRPSRAKQPQVYPYERTLQTKHSC